MASIAANVTFALNADLQKAVLERRYKFIVISKEHIISIAQPFYVPNTRSIVTSCIEGLPINALATDVKYSEEEDVFLIKVFHPDFKPVQIGDLAPRIRTSLQHLTIE